LTTAICQHRLHRRRDGLDTYPRVITTADSHPAVVPKLADTKTSSGRRRAQYTDTVGAATRCSHVHSGPASSDIRQCSDMLWSLAVLDTTSGSRRSCTAADESTIIGVFGTLSSFTLFSCFCLHTACSATSYWIIRHRWLGQ